ncbi:asparagine synthase (glutamine-hydrolyzing) [Mariluticola halotolerans]|uniref:asparagine synthase (glutamine-hydrolyzing) n=1 Tax=Mariluticola halotolerans TaxID=2909283 RepID=UPI0026E21E3C|nr:asparagine synthase (glutamine-hydrolyzing) [Mariluticola halotolerans]UJQ96065.1 asparagine synthase (glutamine-hydrolyzing) [Mariluticola halotolerans]
MCGIIGSVSASLGEDDFARAVRSLEHRGPDHTGIWSDGDVRFGHTRLAINDLSSQANQPFIDPLTGLCVTFNGEIYNYLDLRAELGKAAPFRTKSEAEVIARLYAVKGDKMLEQLDGMFAFVIFDKQKQVLFGARDRLGKKPLFYHFSKSEKRFYFGSELTAFRHFGINISLDTRILDNILNFSFYDGESMLQGVKSLGAGCSFTFRLDTFSFQESKYFDLADLIDEQAYRARAANGLDACTEELAGLMDASVRKRLISDVPVGIIASGGVDSSLIAALANRHGRYDLLHINSVDNSELDDAEALRRMLNVDMSVDQIDYKVFCELFDETVTHWEYPLVHTNATGILLVARLARAKGFKVVLGGEGADELFGGYPQHRQYYAADLLNKGMGWVPTRLLQALVYARGGNKGGGMEPTVQHILNRDRMTTLSERYGFVRSSSQRSMQAFLASELSHYLVPLLSRADRMSMASGVEMRLPFLDIDVIRFALNIPLSFKISLTEQKRVLRRVAAPVLPARSRHKAKTGFTIDYAERYVRETGVENWPQLDKYIPTKTVVGRLLERGQYAKVLRFKSLEKICESLL